jgi:hypothetical protein
VCSSDLFAPVAKHYGVGVDPCPPRHGNHKGVVEKAIDYITQSWWRTAPVATLNEAQASLDRWCIEVADHRLRDSDTGSITVAEAAAGEPLLALPAAVFPVTVTLERTVAANALVAVWGNRYSTPPGFVGANVQVTHRHGTETIEIRAGGGRIVAAHRLAPAGTHRTIRLPEHAAALENMVLAEFNTARPCVSKLNRPPSPLALAIAAQLGSAPDDPVIDLDVYRRVIEGETT